MAAHLRALHKTYSLLSKLGGFSCKLKIKANLYKEQQLQKQNPQAFPLYIN